MLDRIRQRLTYANVMATVAVVGMLGGGGAYAAGKIGPNDIKNNAVRSNHIKNGTIVSRDINRKTRAALRGAEGPQGAVGPKGDAGAQGPQGDPGPSEARSVYRNSAVFSSGVGAGTYETFATLAGLGPGNYVINAKLSGVNRDLTVQLRTLQCVLSAGFDYDVSEVLLDMPGEGIAVRSARSLALQVVHTASGAFNAALSCAYTGTPPSVLLELNDLKITAIKVGSLANTQVSG